jgi:hypothetical protein
MSSKVSLQCGISIRPMSARGQNENSPIWAYVSFFRQLQTLGCQCFRRLVPCMDGARGAREKILTFSRNVPHMDELN